MIKTLLSVLLSTWLLCGCGQTGPLKPADPSESEAGSL